MKDLYLASISALKLRQYRDLVQAGGWSLKHLEADLPEIQSIDLDEVASHKLAAVVRLHPQRPCFVDDTGLYVGDLNGFPGALLKPLLTGGGLRLLGKVTRSAQRDGLVRATLVTVIHLHTGAEVVRVNGRMAGALDFTDESALDAPTTAAIFRPDGVDGTLAEREQRFGAREYRHRVGAVEAALAALGGGQSLSLPAALKVIFFDVDGTLFDHQRAQRAALGQLLAEFPAWFSHLPAEEVFAVYERHNARLWGAPAGRDVSWRDLWVGPFEATVRQLRIAGAESERLAERYSALYGQQNCPCRHAREAVEALGRRYRLGVLSNGFPAVQRGKLRALGLEGHFRHFVFSAEVGAWKPGLVIFQAAARLCACRPEEILYVGDSLEHDILGARAAGWATAYYDRTAVPAAGAPADYVITDLLCLADDLPPPRPGAAGVDDDGQGG